MFRLQVCNVLWKAAQILLNTLVVQNTAAKNMAAPRECVLNTKAKNASLAKANTHHLQMCVLFAKIMLKNALTKRLVFLYAFFVHSYFVGLSFCY